MPISKSPVAPERLFTPDLGEMTPLLRQHAFTAGLDTAHLERLAALAAPIVFGEDETVLARGEAPVAVYLLLTGSVAVELSTPNVRLCIQVLHGGDMVGWSALLQNHETLFHVRAREHTEAIRLDGPALAQACGADPHLAAVLLRRTLEVVSGRIRATEASVAELCGVRLPAR